MKKIFLFLILFISVQAARAQFPITMTGYPLVTTGWTWGGAAGGTTPSVVDSELRITTTGGNEANYLVYNTFITMANYCQWQADFDFQITPSGGSVADGMTFFFLSNPPTSGTTGGGLALPSSPLGLMLIFDTYNNVGVSDVPIIQLLGFTGAAGETAYTEDGTVGELCSFLTNQSFVTNSAWHHVTVTYNLGNINVYFNYSTTASQTGFFDLSSYTGKFGFTGSTGAVTSTQKIKNVLITASSCLTVENNGPICQGDTLKLYAIGDSTGATYAWTGPAASGFTSTAQDPVIPFATLADSGIYRVIRTNSTGGIDTGYTDVVIKQKPVVTATNNSTICAGSDLTFTATPDSTGETFSWTGPNGFTSVIENPTITGATQIDTGIYTVIATWNGCLDTATTYVSIIYVAVPSAGSNSPICAGDSITLTSADAAIGVSFSWSGPGFASSLQNPVIHNATTANAGIYTVTAGIGMCTYTATTTVVVNEIPGTPTNVPILPICSGNVDTLKTADTTAGVTFHWSGPNGFSSNLQDPTIPNTTTSATGVYTVYASLLNCVSPIYTVSVSIDSTPATPVASSNSPICSTIGVILLNSTDATAGVTYSWAGPPAFVSASQDTSILSPLATMSGNYTVTVTLITNAIPCKSSNATFVTVNQTPNLPTVGNNGPVCSGGLLILNSVATPGSGTYYWTGPNSFTSIVEYPQINNVTLAANGIYSIYEIVNGCQSATALDTVVIVPSPAIPVATNNGPICQGADLKLFATDDSSGVTFSWSGPSSFSSVLQNPVIGSAPLTAAGLYLVTVQLGICTETATTDVSITPIPDITVSNNGPICEGDTLKLFATSTSTVTYAWTGPFGYSANTEYPTRFPTILEYAGLYTVTATTVPDVNTASCSITALDTVVINPTPAAPWITWPVYCQYYDAPPLMAVDATDVTWYPSAAGTPGTGTATAPTPSTDVPGIFFFYLNETAAGCVSPIDSVEVTVYPKPVFTISPTASFICPHDSVTLTVTDADPLDNFHWYPDTYLHYDTLSPVTIAYPVTSTNYMVVVSNRFACTDTGYSNVTVYPAGVIFLDAGDSVTLYGGDTYTITSTTNCNTFTWFPPEGLSDPTIADPVVSPSGNTMYIVHGVTDNGCQAADSIYFHVSVEAIFAAPNAFTPGAGSNTVFKLLKKGVGSLNFLRIYDRWGKMVYESNNIDDGWDGTYKGQPQPFGVYVYEFQAVSSATGKLVNMQGNITLLR